jgi:hypothetical protein
VRLGETGVGLSRNDEIVSNSLEDIQLGIHFRAVVSIMLPNIVRGFFGCCYGSGGGPPLAWGGTFFQLLSTGTFFGAPTAEVFAARLVLAGLAF